MKVWVESGYGSVVGVGVRRGGRRVADVMMHYSRTTAGWCLDGACAVGGT